ncbi:hypothetical protein [Bacillus sp. Marseille-P3800]|uniref:hypothetical protein n=1 Tax=Bacillus sp. Marseille-P3800 TaxID=2014782 RepID=UPI000C06FB4C|nr:hypothetical protein [Bacillus sp. Marseille-P3800]
MDERSYFVWLRNHDGVIVYVEYDVNRPNNDDSEAVLERWITDNYGTGADYEYFEVDSLSVVRL